MRRRKSVIEKVPTLSLLSQHLPNLCDEVRRRNELSELDIRVCGFYEFRQLTPRLC